MSKQRQFEKNKPLLYIAQPKSEPLIINMQQTFIVKAPEPKRQPVELSEEETAVPTQTAEIDHDEDTAFTMEIEHDEDTAFMTEIEHDEDKAFTGDVGIYTDNETVESETHEEILMKTAMIKETEEQTVETEVQAPATDQSGEGMTVTQPETAVNSWAETKTVADENKAEDIPSYNRKAFKDMTVEEKLDYLVNKPFYIPKIICDITAADQVYTGVVASMSDGKVYIHLSEQLGMAEVDAAAITQIRMRPR